MPIFSNKSIKLYYHTEGKGMPLVLLSGLGGDHQSVWPPCFERFAKRYCLIAVDTRNSGKSQFFNDPFTIRDMAHDIKMLLDGLGIEKVHLGGFSMGGLIAQQFARDYPDRLDRLILACTYSTMNNRNHLFMEGVCAAYEQSRSLQTIFDLVYPVLFRQAYYETLPHGRERILLPPEELNEPFTGWLRLYEAQRAFDSRSWLDEISHKTLVIGGSEDFFVPLADLELLGNKIPNATLVTVPESGHMLTFEQPEKFQKAVLEFLS